VSEKILQAYDTEMAGVKIIELPREGEIREQINRWLDAHHRTLSALQLLDPNGARMMQYPISADGPEFNKMRKDIEKLMQWNPIGKKVGLKYVGSINSSTSFDCIIFGFYSINDKCIQGRR
jgi:hypothetical protein